MPKSKYKGYFALQHDSITTYVNVSNVNVSGVPGGPGGLVGGEEPHHGGLPGHDQVGCAVGAPSFSGTSSALIV
jgi:hypothetical protein